MDHPSHFLDRPLKDIFKHTIPHSQRPMIKTCNAHHPMDTGPWMNVFMRFECDLCAKGTANIALNCPTCVIDVCAPCASKYGDRVGFALHLASGGRLGLLENSGDIENDPDSALYREFHRFHNTDVYRAKLKARILEIDEYRAKLKTKILELERVMAGVQEELDDHKFLLAESDARRGD